MARIPLVHSGTGAAAAFDAQLGLGGENDNDEEEELFEPVGTLRGRVVGVRYYRGLVSNHESVFLEREPTNQYDRNAIRVNNVVGHQVGHLKREMAAALAPPIDKGKVRLEGVIPFGSQNMYEMPVDITVLAPLTTFAPMQKDFAVRCSRGGFSFQPKGDLKKLIQERTDEKHQADSLKLQADLESIFDELGIGGGGTEEMKTPSWINTPLMLHQRRALHFLTSTEKKRGIIDAASDDPKDIMKARLHNLFWEKKMVNGKTMFQNSLTNTVVAKVPLRECGAILADDMGLGKTLTTLALIAQDRQATAAKRRRPTLVVAPLSVLNSWIENHERHTKTERLPVHVFHGSKRTRDSQDLNDAAIVLTTYGTLAVELGYAPQSLLSAASSSTPASSSSSSAVATPPSRKRKRFTSSPLFEVDWRRVVLDEAHYVRNVNTKQAKSVMALRADSRVCITGTPLQNKINDLFALVAFLRVPIFSDPNWFARLITRPLAQHETAGVTIIQSLMGSICLRRTKNTMIDGKPIVELPEKVLHLRNVELTPAERNIYDAVSNRAASIFTNLEARDQVMRRYSSMLVMLLRLRQLCDHPMLALKACSEDMRKRLLKLGDEGADAVKMLENAGPNPTLDHVKDIIMTALSRLGDADSEEDECIVCMDNLPDEVVVLGCTHLLCSTCWQEWSGKGHSSCPSCRANIEADKVHRVSRAEYSSQIKELETSGGKGKEPATGLTESDDDEEIDDEDDSDGDGSDDEVEPVVIAEKDEEFVASLGNVPVVGEGSLRRSSRRRVPKKSFSYGENDDNDNGDEDVATPSPSAKKQQAMKSKRKPAEQQLVDEKNHEEEKHDADNVGLELSSSKIDAILDELESIHEANKSDKALIFSQFVTFFDLLETAMKAKGIKFARLDGSMSLARRADALSQFRKDKSIRVMLISLAAGGVGIDLSCANHALVVDPWWNPAVEEQAVDRVHRLGQTKTVHVTRFIVNNSIEENMRDLQELKQQMQKMVLHRHSKDELRALRLDILSKLFREN